MKFSSSFKVGLLTLAALILLVGTVLKVKGRAFSSAKRIEIQFKDVNGLRPGAGVQIMGLKVGQVEEITPVVEGEDSFVNVKFVITDPSVQIPEASSFSIQQSGLIGELFLEITPPKVNTIYIPMVDNKILYKNDKVQMKLSGKYYDVGVIKGAEVVTRDSIPFNYKNSITTPKAYKVSNPAFQDLGPTTPSTVRPALACHVFVAFSVPLPKIPSAVTPTIICHTFTTFPLEPFLIVFML